MNTKYTDYQYTPEFVPWESERFMDLKYAAGHMFDNVPLAPVCKFNAVKASSIKSNLPLEDGQIDKERFDLNIDCLYMYVWGELYCAKDVAVKQTFQEADSSLEYRIKRAIVFTPYGKEEGDKKEAYVDLSIKIDLNGEMDVNYGIDFLDGSTPVGLNISYYLNEVIQ